MNGNHTFYSHRQKVDGHLTWTQAIAKNRPKKKSTFSFLLPVSNLKLQSGDLARIFE